LSDELTIGLRREDNLKRKQKQRLAVDVRQVINIKFDYKWSKSRKAPVVITYSGHT
jgi:hypothetical protein